jgi:hypothetical protein
MTAAGPQVKTTTYGVAGSFARGTAGGQVGCDLISGEHAPGARTGEAFLQMAHQFGAGQHPDRLAQPVQLTRGHDVGNMIAVGDYRNRLAMLGSAHHLHPGRLVLGTYGDGRFAHVSTIGGRPRSRREALGH